MSRVGYILVFWFPLVGEGSIWVQPQPKRDLEYGLIVL